MENILATLHLDVTALLWHSANFLVLVAILWLLFFRPFARVIEQRQKRIHESLARAEEIDRLDSVAEAERQSAGARRRRCNAMSAAHVRARMQTPTEFASARLNATRRVPELRGSTRSTPQRRACRSNIAGLSTRCGVARATQRQSHFHGGTGRACGTGSRSLRPIPRRGPG